MKLKTMVRKNENNGPFMNSLHWLPKNKFWQYIQCFLSRICSSSGILRLGQISTYCSCFSNCVRVCSAKVFTSQYETGKVWHGWSECTLKQGCFEHALFSRNKAFTERMELSQHIWDLKKRNSDNNIHWTILCKVYAPHRNSRIATCAPPKKNHA